MRKWLLAAICLGAALLSSCGTKPPSASADVFAMDTYMTISTYGDRCEEALEAAVSEIERLDALLSVGNADSEISRINAGGSGTLSADTQIMVEQALEIWRTTGGAFDITVYPIMQAWGFTTGDYKVPSKSELQALLEMAGSEKLTLDGFELTLGAGQRIDLGGIAKGYTSDRAEAIFRAVGVESGSISLGGNVYVQGSKPDGSPWRVAVQDPQNSSAAAVVLELSDAYAVTSGGYQRYFDQDGKRYHHIIDPATGSPADSGLLSVTVVASANGDTDGILTGHGTMCDAFSTALFVMGEEKALDFWRSGQYDFDLVLVTDDGRVVITEGLADSFEQSEGSGYAYEIAH